MVTITPSDVQALVRAIQGASGPAHARDAAQIRDRMLEEDRLGIAPLPADARRALQEAAYASPPAAAWPGSSAAPSCPS